VRGNQGWRRSGNHRQTGRQKRLWLQKVILCSGARSQTWGCTP
jgi:hypothetical protein